ncbi:hypothetical protein BH24DEI2_BH24DEI2_14780 [soil metagenome]
MLLKPFVFDSESSRESLLNKLGHIGLELVEEHQGCRECEWTLECRWLANKCVAIWLQAWWPDGVHREDVGMRLFHGTETLAEVAFSDLSAEAESTSLRAVITQRVTQVFSEATGKHV